MARDNVGFTTPEVAKATGLTERQTGYWAKTGLVVPSVKNAHGTGNHRRFDIRDVYTFATLGMLRDRGVSLQALRVIQRYIQSCKGQELQDVHARLVWAPGNRRYRQDVALVHSAEEIVSLLAEPGQYIAPVVVDVGKLYSEVRERLEVIRQERTAKAAKRAERSTTRRKKRTRKVA